MTSTDDAATASQAQIEDLLYAEDTGLICGCCGDPIDRGQTIAVVDGRQVHYEGCADTAGGVHEAAIIREPEGSGKTAAMKSLLLSDRLVEILDIKNIGYAPYVGMGWVVAGGDEPGPRGDGEAGCHG